MSDREFVGQMIHMLKEQFPKLYVRHVKGRHLEFVQENVPPELLEDKGRVEQILGHLNKDLRMLLALGVFFSRESGLSVLRVDDLHKASEMQLFIHAFAFQEIASLCREEVWFFVKKHFGPIEKTKDYLIRSVDWSVRSVDHIAVRSMMSSHQKMVLRRVQGQVIVDFLAGDLLRLARH